jgi:septal ring factor EnvC (AmiA/AmiB activator)
LRRQAEEQEQSLKSQEDELSSKKQELEGLKQEEAKLERQQKDSREQLDNLTKNLQDTQLQISQVIGKWMHCLESMVLKQLCLSYALCCLQSFYVHVDIIYKLSLKYLMIREHV